MYKLALLIALVAFSCGDIAKQNQHLIAHYFLVRNEAGDSLICYKDSGGALIAATPGSVKKYWVCDSLLITKVLENFQSCYYIINTKKDFGLSQGYEFKIGPLTQKQINNDTTYARCIDGL